MSKKKYRERGYKDSRLYKKIGYSFVAVYTMTAIVLLIFLVRLKMIPDIYIGVFGTVLLVFSVLFLLMQRWKSSSVIADILCAVIVVISIASCVYISKMDTMIRDVSTASAATDEIGVFVQKEDSAQNLEDVADYLFGIAEVVDRESTDVAIEDMEKELGKTTNISEYSDMYKLLDGLQSGEIRAIIINSAYLDIAEETEKYSWVKDGLRQIASFTHEEKVEPVQEVEEKPKEESDSFIMYLSGIDTYGRVGTRSRSDVNIMVVVNTETKNILLLSTPRDYYISYSVTGGAKDKLTHAGIYGVEASMDAISQLYDVNIDYYLRMNFTGFTQIIDALGGVEVYSDYEFNARGTQIHQGYNTLNGEQALSFARERYSFQDGDFQRGKNQMQVIYAVIQKVASPALLKNYMNVMNAVAESFETNMPQEKIAELVKMQITDMASWNITSYAVTGQVSRAETFSAPGQMLSVVIPDESSIEEAKRKINEVLQEE